MDTEEGLGDMGGVGQVLGGNIEVSDQLNFHERIW